MKWLTILYSVLYLYFCTDFISIINSYKPTESTNLLRIFESALITGTVSVIVFIFDSLISSKLKNWMLGSFIIPVYGCTVFTKIGSNKFKDERVSCQAAKETYSKIITNLPKDRKERMIFENEQWNKIYVEFESNGAVKQSQKDWLLCRDMYIETILFTVFYLVSTLIFNNIAFSLTLLVTLIVMAIILNFAAHNKMKRFVYTVIAKSVLSNTDNVENNEANR